MSTPRRPNVLVIMSDEHSYDTMGCTGNRAAVTPALDALADQGVVFDQFYTPFPLCCPSRTSLLTGLMPRHHHVLGNWRGIRPDLADRGLGNWFVGAGYHTFYVGKWHVPGTDPSRMGFADRAAIPAVIDGKDRGRYIPDYREYATESGYQLVPENIENLTADDLAALHAPGSHRTRSAIDLQHYLEPWQTDRFAEVLGRAPDDRPWFGVCSYNAPHFPFAVPAPYDQLIDRSRITLPASWPVGFDDLPSEVAQSHFAQDFTDLDERGWIDVIGHYYGMISLVDDQVGRIVELLRSRGELRKTIIVFTSDHGDMMGAHRLMQKGHLLPYEESVHIPLIITHPDGRTGRDAGLHSMPDLTATLFDLAGLDVPGDIDGRSFADGRARDYVSTESILWGRDSEAAHGEHRDPATFCAGPDTINLSITDRDYRYIFRSDDIDELFDRVADPAEITNLAADRPRVVARYRKLLHHDVSDVFPDPFLSSKDHTLERT